MLLIEKVWMNKKGDNKMSYFKETLNDYCDDTAYDKTLFFVGSIYIELFLAFIISITLIFVYPSNFLTTLISDVLTNLFFHVSDTLVGFMFLKVMVFNITVYIVVKLLSFILFNPISKKHYRKIDK